MVARPYLSAEPKWWKAEQAGLTVQLYLYRSSKSLWVPSKQTTDQLPLKVQIITKKKNYTLQGIILKVNQDKVVVHFFFKVKYPIPASPFFQVC